MIKLVLARIKKFNSSETDTGLYFFSSFRTANNLKRKRLGIDLFPTCFHEPPRPSSPRPTRIPALNSHTAPLRHGGVRGWERSACGIVDWLDHEMTGKKVCSHSQQQNKPRQQQKHSHACRRQSSGVKVVETADAPIPCSVGCEIQKPNEGGGWLLTW